MAVDWTDETFRTLDEIARTAFPPDTGVTADTLKRLARRGKLTVYRPGKSYLSRLVDVRVMLDATRILSKTPPSSMADRTFPDPLERTESGVARARLDYLLAELTRPHEVMMHQRKEERLRTAPLRRLEARKRRNERARKKYREKKDAARK